MRRQGVFVVAGSDEQWKGTWRQQGARLIAPWYLHSAIDVLWVAGERQRQFARRLGYRGAQCWEGVYGCDWGQFAAHHSPSQSLPHAFLFVGRYEHEKGLDVLVQAYQRYREQVESPWPLLCAGEGTLKSLLAETAGIHDRGFTQPDDLPALMEQAGAFVLPSRDEPWGVVVEEAAAAGRPLICTEACGAGVHLVRDGHNGYLARPGDPEHLSECLLQMSRISEAKRSRMGTRSHELSKQYTPTQWVETLVTGIQRWYANNHVTERVAAQ
jgi:glycosyltransferase involved in cell wall biosynthesis